MGLREKVLSSDRMCWQSGGLGAHRIPLTRQGHTSDVDLQEHGSFLGPGRGIPAT